MQGTNRAPGRTRPDTLNTIEVLEFMQRLWALDHALQSFSKQMQRRFGVTGPQRLVIRFVGKSPGISAGELAAILEVHPSTLTGVFRRLEKQNLIRRGVVREDGRRAAFHLLPRGREIDRMRGSTVEDVLRRTLSVIPDEKVLATKEVLESLASALRETLDREAGGKRLSYPVRAAGRRHGRE
jgi:DNA-binding MarR family transcriptional regulator